MIVNDIRHNNIGKVRRGLKEKKDGYKSEREGKVGLTKRNVLRVVKEGL